MMMRGEKGVMSSRSSRPEFQEFWSSWSSSSGVPEFSGSPVLPGESSYNNSIDTPLSPAFLEILANPKISSSEEELLLKKKQYSNLINYHNIFTTLKIN